MKRTMKKITAFILATAVLAGNIVGCSGGDNKQQSKETQQKSDGGNTQQEFGKTAEEGFKDYSNGFEDTVHIQIPVYDRALEGWNLTDNTYTRWVQLAFGDKYNINVEFVAIGRTTEVADYMQMLSAGTAPDIIMHYDMPQAINYYAEEAVQPINLEEIAYYAPGYFEKMGDVIKQYGEMDDQTYFFFADRPSIYYNYVNLIRKDWVDAVGAEMPTSREELEEIAEKWKNAGLGTLGTRLLSSGFIYHYGFLGDFVDEKELALYSDLSIAPLTWEPSKKFLQNFNYEYNNGLIDTEFYLKDDDAKWKADFAAGKVGTFSFYINSNTDVISAVKANDPNAEIAVLDVQALVPEGNNAYYYQYPPYGLIMGINHSTSDEERIATWMYLEWLNQEENLFQFQNDVEGESYNLDEDGLPIAIDGYEGEWKRSSNNNKDYWCLASEGIKYDDEDKNIKAQLRELAPAGYEYLIEDSRRYWEAQEKYGLLNTAYTKIVEASVENSADLKALWQELYVDCVTCPEEEFEQRYEEACQTYLDAGYQDIIAEKQKLYEAGEIK